ncbi:MAG: homoserine kinase [Tsuneonella sp.]
MAVYTHLGAEDLAVLIAEYDVGSLISAKGIAEGVSNSNWLIETHDEDEPEKDGRFILTMYERRIETSDLPFFLGLLDHLSAKGCPVPRTIHDRSGAAWRRVQGKAVALIEFLPGVSVDRPSAAQARAVGAALAGVHLASADFAGTRENGLRPRDWQGLFDHCGDAGLASIDPELPSVVGGRMPEIARLWPEGLPRSIIHADLFPDNVLILGGKVTGLIDFYFACRDLTAYDLAVTHAAWCFADEGRTFRSNVAAALMAGYEAVRPLSAEERAALPTLAQGAALRFIATRAADWLDTPADALVRRKDPMDFARRLQFYAEAGDSPFTRAAG